MNLTTLGWDGGWAEALADHDDRALVPARVTAVHRGRYAVRGDDIDALVPAAGALEAAARGPAELPATGDWVALRGGEAIRHVLPRRTLLARADDDAREEALAANVDLCLVTTSLDMDLNLRRLERFVALARAGGVEVLVVCTKGDLARDPIAEAAAVSAATGAEAIVLSARDGWGVSALRARLRARPHARPRRHVRRRQEHAREPPARARSASARWRCASATRAGATRRRTASCSRSTTARC